MHAPSNAEQARGERALAAWTEKLASAAPEDHAEAERMAARAAEQSAAIEPELRERQARRGQPSDGRTA